MSKVVSLLSGGLDSTTLLYDLLSEGHEVYPISFNYGQKHSKELEIARLSCSKLGLTLRVLDLSVLGEVAPSALTREDVKVPKGSYTDESMKQTVVPNRNMVLLSLAISYAIGLGAKEVYYGAHSGDHAIYPDCRREFVTAMREAAKLCDWSPVTLYAPYLEITKGGVLEMGLRLGVDFSLTWSCYEGQELACGKCGSCVERLEAFRENGVRDPIRYKEE